MANEMLTKASAVLIMVAQITAVNPSSCETDMVVFSICRRAVCPCHCMAATAAACAMVTPDHSAANHYDYDTAGNRTDADINMKRTRTITPNGVTGGWLSMARTNSKLMYSMQ